MEELKVRLMGLLESPGKPDKRLYHIDAPRPTVSDRSLLVVELEPEVSFAFCRTR